MNREMMNSKIESQPSYERLPEPVYYVESPDDSTVLVGMDVTIKTERNGEKTVSWHDTIRERSMCAEEIQKNDKYFAFKRSEREGGGTYFFEPMDLDTYQNKVKEHLAHGENFDNKEDLIKAFRETLEYE